MGRWTAREPQRPGGREIIRQLELSTGLSWLQLLVLLLRIWKPFALTLHFPPGRVCVTSQERFYLPHWEQEHLIMGQQCWRNRRQKSWSNPATGQDMGYTLRAEWGGRFAFLCFVAEWPRLRFPRQKPEESKAHLKEKRVLKANCWAYNLYGIRLRWENLSRVVCVARCFVMPLKIMNKHE